MDHPPVAYTESSSDAALTDSSRRPQRKAARQEDSDDEPLLPTGGPKTPPKRSLKSTELSKKAESQVAAALKGSAPISRELREGGGRSTKDSGLDSSAGASSQSHPIQEAMQA